MDNQDIIWNSDVIDNQDIIWNSDVIDNQDIIWNSDVMDNQDIMWDFDVIDNQSIMWNSDINKKGIKQLSWINNLTELKTFIDLNKRRPSHHKDTEKVLYVWLYNQVVNRKIKTKIMNNENIRNIWDHFIEDYDQYFLSNEKIWNNNLTELKKFIDLNERRPSENKDTEKVLSKWLSHQLYNRKTENNIMNNENIRNIWDSFIKDYKKYIISNEELWNNNLTELKTFIDLNKRRPSIYKKTEKVIGKWLSHQLINIKNKRNIMINEDIRNTWNHFIKDNNQYFISNRELWNNNLTELKIFIDLNKRKPSICKGTEKMLGIWLSAQLQNRKTEKKIMINEDIRNIWDRFIKDNNQYFMSNKELWYNNLTELKIFIDLNKRKPSTYKGTEKMLGIWLSTQLQNRKTEKKTMINEDIRNAWDRFIKDNNQYLISNNELLTSKLAEFR